MRFLLFLSVLCLPLHDVFATEGYADLVEELMPSVVNISTEKSVIANNEEIDNLMLEPALDGRETLGSGFFIRDNGYILTNAHVINGAKKISVITNNGKTYNAKIKGIDKPSDLAVLKIEPAENKSVKETFTPVKFGNTDASRIGDIVLTFGNPYGLGVSVSQGIISAKSRKTGLNEQPYIQTDAAINQGNSGGPMFNLSGEVIGINSAIFTSAGASGIGFSLPSNIANWVSAQLIDTGKVKRGWTGLTVANGIDQYTNKSGFVITEIDEDSNAYKEGLRVGEIIIAYNDKPATNLDEFMRFTETMEPGQVLRVKTLSYGEEIRNVIRIQEMPNELLKDATNKALIESNKYYHENADKDVYYISELRIAVKEANPRGLSIVKIEKNSPLKETGINIGDIILDADRNDIYSPDNLLDSLHNAMIDNYRPLTLFVQGLDNTFYTTIELAPENE